ncbi:MAG: hypothetical protein EP338_00135 [Bacteroidetes bacterium]|nr:MAG: hypothetical protein EP338_00135 [Bacteroidota bacterium]
MTRCLKLNSIIKLFFFLITPYCFTQGSLLVVSKDSCLLTIDGEISQKISPNKPQKFDLSEGEHLIQAKNSNQALFNEIVTIETNKQKVLSVNFSEPKKQETKTTPVENPLQDFLLVSDLQIDLSGAVNELIFDDYNHYSAYKEFYYAFDQGDEIRLDAILLNKKGSFDIRLTKYPEFKETYVKKNLVRLDSHPIQIPEKSIYILQVATNSIFDKQIDMTIRRKPNNPSGKSFNTSVVKKYKYEAVKLLEPSYHYLNSTSNEDLLGGQCRTLLAVNVPKDIVEWYYTVSASRDKGIIQKNMKTFSLFGRLAGFLAKSNVVTASIMIGANIITPPPGSHNCNVYMLDYENISPFNHRQAFSYTIQGTREKVKSSTVKIQGYKGMQCYLGVDNPDSFNGLHVLIEAVGIKRNMYLDYAN